MTGVLDRPAPPPDLTMRYGPRAEHVVDLRFPRANADRAAPLIVLIHGGFWRPAYDRMHLGPMGHALAAAGYVVAVPEYRRAGMAEEGWTGTFGDIALVADQVAGIAGAHGADTGAVTWAGHSAGGHLALWAAARPGLPLSGAGSPWRGPFSATHVVALAACSSLRLCAEWNLGEGAVLALMGGGPEEVRERYAVADPAALSPPPVPVTLVHGTADDQVPVSMSQAFGAGRLVEIPGAGHFDLIDPESRAWPTVLAVLAGTQESGRRVRRDPPSGNRAGEHPGSNRGTEVTGKQTCGETPGLAPLRTWASHLIMSRRTNRAAVLIPRCRPEPDDQFGRYPATVLDLNTLRLGPFADLRGVQPAGRTPAAGTRGPTRSSTTAPPRGLDVTR